MHIHRRHLLALVLAALVSGWAGIALNRRAGREGMDGPGALLWLLGPLAAAGIAAPRTTGAAIARSLRPRGTGDLALAAAVALIPPLISAASLAAGVLTGRVDTSRLETGPLLREVVTVLRPSAVKNLAEEATWRAVLTAGLVENGVPDAVVDLVVGSVWGLWHLPYYAVLLDEPSVIAAVGEADRTTLAVIGSVTTAAWAPLFTEIHHRSGSLWPGLVLHSVANAVPGALQLGDALRYGPGGRGLFSPLLGAVPGALMFGAGLALRVRRRRRERDLG